MTRSPLPPGSARAAAGAGLALLLLGAGRRLPPGGRERWDRTNHRGRSVSLVAGPVLALAVTAASPLPPAARLVAGLGAGAAGLYDDAVGGRQAQAGAKGFRGHVAALRGGRMTSGTVKVTVIGASGVAAAHLLDRARGRTAGGPDALLAGALVAGSANLLNLFDLRPGRALKAGLAVAVASRQPVPAAVAAALLPADLAERTMLGDTGANALGALLGLGLLDRTPGRAGRLPRLAVVVLLTAASEVVSFTRVIDAVPPLRALDRWGRLP